MVRPAGRVLASASEHEDPLTRAAAYDTDDLDAVRQGEPHERLQRRALVAGVGRFIVGSITPFSDSSAAFLSHRRSLLGV